MKKLTKILLVVALVIAAFIGVFSGIVLYADPAWLWVPSLVLAALVMMCIAFVYGADPEGRGWVISEYMSFGAVLSLVLAVGIACFLL